MKKLLILLLALLAIAAIAYFCVYKTQIPAIQSDIQSRAQSALSNNNLAGVKAQVDGRDITLTGVAASEKMKQVAGEVAQVNGFNLVNNQIQVSGDASAQGGSGSDAGLADPLNDTLDDTMPKKHSIGITLDEKGQLTIDGLLDAKSHKALREAAIASHGEANVQDRVLDLDIPVAEGMPEIAIATLNKLSDLKSGEAVIIGDKIEFKGVGATKEAVAQVESQLKAEIPKNYELNFNLSIAESGNPVIPAPVQNNKTDKKPTEKLAKAADLKRCQRQFNNVLRRNKVRFNSSKAVVKRSSFRGLQRIVAVAKRCPGMKITVHGHTDSSGRNKLNRALSKKRARAVATYLAKKGIPRKYLTSIGHGSSRSIANNKTTKGRARNRRIEITVESIK